jgi:excisionase family DNA binding protein
MIEYLTTEEVAQKLRLAPSTVQKWINAGRLPAVFVGRRYLIRVADVDRVLCPCADARDQNLSTEGGAS